MSWIYKYINLRKIFKRSLRLKISARTLKKSKILTKIALGGLLCLIFFSGYQPVFNFPPVKSSKVLAQDATLTQIVEASKAPIVFQLPMPGYLSTPFSSFHPGIDIASGLGMPIKPIAKGTVSEVGYNFWGLGLVVEVDHGLGYKSLYAHMGKTYVSRGQEVDENSFLGEVGLTGNTSGPHTHLEVSKDNQKIDPRIILPTVRENPEESDFIAQNSDKPSTTSIPYKPVAAVSTPAPVSTPQPTAPPTTAQILNQPLVTTALGTTTQSLQILK